MICQNAWCDFNLWNASWFYCVFWKFSHIIYVLSIVSLPNFHRLCLINNTFKHNDMPDVPTGYGMQPDLISIFDMIYTHQNCVLHQFTQYQQKRRALKSLLFISVYFFNWFSLRKENTNVEKMQRTYNSHNIINPFDWIRFIYVWLSITVHYCCEIMSKYAESLL